MAARNRAERLAAVDTDTPDSRGSSRDGAASDGAWAVEAADAGGGALGPLAVNDALGPLGSGRIGIGGWENDFFKNFFEKRKKIYSKFLSRTHCFCGFLNFCERKGIK